jgi:hypothetical protein
LPSSRIFERLGDSTIHLRGIRSRGAHPSRIRVAPAGSGIASSSIAGVGSEAASCDSDVRLPPCQSPPLIDWLLENQSAEVAPPVMTNQYVVVADNSGFSTERRVVTDGSGGTVGTTNVQFSSSVPGSPAEFVYNPAVLTINPSSSLSRKL